MKRITARVPSQHEAGLTIIEILVAVSILLLIGAISIPILLSQRESSRESVLSANANTAAKDMEMALLDVLRWGYEPTMTAGSGRSVEIYTGWDGKTKDGTGTITVLLPGAQTFVEGTVGRDGWCFVVTEQGMWSKSTHDTYGQMSETPLTCD